MPEVSASASAGQRENAGPARGRPASRGSRSGAGAAAGASSRTRTGSGSATPARLPAAPLADRCVIGFKGLLNEAIEQAVVPQPPLCNHNDWKKWRSTLGKRPTVRGGVRGSDMFTTPKEELHLHKFAMRKCYGSNWFEDLQKQTLRESVDIQSIMREIKRSCREF